MIKAPALFEIPAGATSTRCAGCRREIWKVVNPKTGNTQPLTIGERYAQGTGARLFEYNGESVEVPGAMAPHAAASGKGWNHFMDCPDREAFRREKR